MSGENARPKSFSNLLRDYESRNVTVHRAGRLVADRLGARQGVHVWDADGKKYLDLTAAFGVAAAGHANPRVVKAGQRQMAKLLHAMGDVHPHALQGRTGARIEPHHFRALDVNGKNDHGKDDFQQFRF